MLVPPGQVNIPVAYGTVIVHQIPNPDGTYFPNGVVTLGVDAIAAGSSVDWSGVDGESGGLVIVVMNNDRDVVVTISPPLALPTATPAPLPTATPVPTPTPTPIPTATPTPTTTPVATAGSWSTPTLDVSVVPETLQVGETAVVTVTAFGQGGLPQYTLSVDSAFLKINTPNPLGNSNFRTDTQWTIEAVAVGSTSILVGMSYETQSCSDGACFFHFANTGSAPVAVAVIAAIPPPAAGQIIFSSDREGNPQIYRMDADGSGQTRLTFNEFIDFDPAWSPDGARIAFESFRDGNNEIYAMNADGSNQTRLTFNDASDRHPAWSPDGARIVFLSRRDGNSEIYTMNADGSNQTRLTFNEGKDIYPAWSP